MVYPFAVEQSDTVYSTTPALYLTMLTQNKSLEPALQQVTSYPNGIRMHDMVPCRLHFE